LTQLRDEGAYDSEVNYFFRAGIEVAVPPFPQDIQYNQTVDEYQQVNMVPVALPHIQQKLE
jgi:hypothetical protein